MTMNWTVTMYNISNILIYNRGHHATTHKSMIAEKYPKVEHFGAGRGRYIIFILLYETDNVQ